MVAARRARMREFVLRDARDLGDAGTTARRSTSEGEFYRHTLMTPFFDPGPQPVRRCPRCSSPASGRAMTEVAGEVADGFIVHALHAPSGTLREVTLPALERGLGDGRAQPRADFEISCPLFVVDRRPTTRRSRAAASACKQQIAFYGSTPAYRGCSTSHGWGDLQPELNRLSKQGEWVEMGELIDDEIARHVRGARRARRDRPEDRARYGDLVDRVQPEPARRRRHRPLRAVCVGRFRGPHRPLLVRHPIVR